MLPSPAWAPLMGNTSPGARKLTRPPAPEIIARAPAGACLRRGTGVAIMAGSAVHLAGGGAAMRTITAVLLLAGALVPPARAEGDEAEAALRKVSASIIRDETRPGRPIVRFSVKGQEFTDEEMRLVGGVKTLQTLDLGFAPVTDEGLKELQALPELRTLGLEGTRVTDAGLAALRPLTTLQTLNLRSTWVTDAGLKELQGLQDLRTLSLYRA